MTDPLLGAYSNIAMGDVASKRLGRAWKLVSNGRLETKLLQYSTDAFSCGCMDFQVRGARDGLPWYHILALQLATEAGLLDPVFEYRVGEIENV